MSFKIGANVSRKDRIAARFLGQTHALLSNIAVEVFREKGITQSEMARQLGVDRSFVSRILKGVGNPTIRTIGEIAGVLGYRPQLVFHKVERMEGTNLAPINFRDESVGKEGRVPPQTSSPNANIPFIVSTAPAT
ncbi:MAG: helix-turn-helix transcriptional regulator [Aestuariivirga sp.]